VARHAPSAAAYADRHVPQMLIRLLQTYQVPLRRPPYRRIGLAVALVEPPVRYQYHWTALFCFKDFRV